MLTDELDYELPTELIAQDPIEPRDSARLLVDRGAGSAPVDMVVADLATLIRPGDVIVVNETRVMPARVAVKRSTGGSGEVLFLRPRPEVTPGGWEALCRPSRKLAEGDTVTAVDGPLRVTMTAQIGEGRWIVTAATDDGPLDDQQLLDALDLSGVMPLPPYIDHVLADRERYQTVYSRHAASAAAPTAGLHFTDPVMQQVAAAGAVFYPVELVVGLDTFRPVTSTVVEEHRIHSEIYSVPEATWRAVTEARAEGRRVVAVGTTSVRALESVARTGMLSGETNLFITPGYRFAAVDVLMTNFHMPRTTLLAMIEAFVGRRWRDLYHVAIERRYRFLSFGDAMWLEHPVSHDPADEDPSVDVQAGRGRR